MKTSANWLRNAWPPVLLLVLFWSTSFYGLDFGVHWDEDRAKFDAIKKSIDRGILLQSIEEMNGYGYNYGGVNYWLTWTGMSPELVKWFVKGPRTQDAWSAAMGPIVFTPKIRMRVRAIYVVLSSLAIVWLYCLCLVLERTRLEATLAAAFLTFSWEFAYHARWVAPDVIMMQFALLAVLCMAIAMKRRSLGWFYWSAIVVGLTAGTKYPGVLLLPFVVIAAAQMLWYERPSLRYVLKHAVFLSGTTVLTFVASTPGSVLDPFRFRQQIAEQQAMYALGFFGYSVRPGLPHVGEMVKYFLLQGLSHYWSISILLGVFCILGVLALARERKLLTILVTGFLVVYLGLFSRQAAMLVRNMIVVFPFLCFAAARGVNVVSQRIGSYGARALRAAIGIVLLVNLGWEVSAARQIGNRSDLEYFRREFEDYAQSQPKDTFFVSADLLTSLNRLPDPLPANVTGKPDAAFTKVALFQSEGPDTHSLNWPANFWNTYDKTFGAQEVNLEAYPTFVGNERILVVSKESLARLPVTPQSLAVPNFSVSKTEVTAGTDFYVLRIKNLPGGKAHVRYSLNGAAPAEAALTLDAKGEILIDIGPTVAKGSYRFLEYRSDLENVWHKVDVTVVVK